MRKHLPFVIVVTLLLASCATADNRTRPNLEQRLLEMGLQLGESNSHIPRYRINGWSAIDDLNLIITAGVNDKYLIRLSSPCLGLEGSFFIGFTTPMTRLGRFDRIVVRSIERGREYCRIQDIVHLEKSADT